MRKWHDSLGNDEIQENFAMTDEEMAQIAALNRNVHYYTSTSEMQKEYAEMVPPVDEQR